jgi:hypothetical protein
MRTMACQAPLAAPAWLRLWTGQHTTCGSKVTQPTCVLQVRADGGIAPLVRLLNSWDLKVQRAAAGALRTLAFKNDDNKRQIVECGALPLLIQVLVHGHTCFMRVDADRKIGCVPAAHVALHAMGGVRYSQNRQVSSITFSTAATGQSAVTAAM